MVLEKSKLTVVNGKMNHKILKDVLLVPKMMYNLIAISRVHQTNFRVIIENEGDNPHLGIMKVTSKNIGVTELAGLETSGRLYKSLLKVDYNRQAHVIESCIEAIWHQRLGHCNKDVLKAPIPHI